MTAKTKDIFDRRKGAFFCVARSHLATIPTRNIKYRTHRQLPPTYDSVSPIISPVAKQHDGDDDRDRWLLLFMVVMLMSSYQ